MLTRKRILGSIAVISVVLVSMLGYGAVRMAYSPDALPKAEVVQMVERVHGTVELQKQKYVGEAQGWQDVSDYMFTDEHGIDFRVRVGVAGTHDDEQYIVQDMWVDSYLNTDDAHKLIQSHGGKFESSEHGDMFVMRPQDAEQDAALREALAKQVPMVPVDMPVSYRTVSRCAVVEDNTPGAMQLDLFEYIVE